MQLCEQNTRSNAAYESFCNALSVAFLLSPFMHESLCMFVEMRGVCVRSNITV